MNLSAFVIKMAFFALPGLLASQIYRKARGRRAKKNWEDFVEILLFSLLSYLIVGLVYYCSCDNKSLNVDSMFDETASIDEWGTIGFASLIGVLLALFASFIHKFRVISRFLILCKISNRLGDEDLWELFNTDNENDQWLFIRDHKLNLIYFGQISLYSESEKERELVIEKVTVYNAVSEKLYDTPKLYLCRDKYDITIELKN